VEYVVHWREVGEGGYTYSWETDTQREISGLEANTTYEWWVSARNDYAIGDDSETWQFTTPAESSDVSRQGLDRDFAVDDDGTNTAFIEQDNKR
jgi:hypothetical protein